MMSAQNLVAMIGAGIVGGLIASLLVWTNTARARANVATVVEAQRFVLRDTDGKEWAHLQLSGGGPHFSMLGPDGHRMINLSVMPQGAGLILGDLEKTDAGQAVLIVSNTGSPQFNLNAKGTISLRVAPQEGQKIYIFDDQKKLLFEAPAP
jgi:hypothetical protein